MPSGPTTTASGATSKRLSRFRRAGYASPPMMRASSWNAAIERQLGRWDDALAHLGRAREHDPRSWRVLSVLGATLAWLRRTDEARAAIDRALVFAPAHLNLIHNKAMTFLQEGDLAGARAVLAAVPKEVEPTALAVDFASDALSWVLDDAQRDVLLRLTPGAFGGNRWAWGLTLAEAWALRGDPAKVRAVRRGGEKDLRGSGAGGPGPGARCLLGPGVRLPGPQG